MITLVVTAHARVRFEQRGVGENDILAALQSCFEHRPAHHGRRMHLATVRGQTLKVVTVEQSCTGRLTIVTAMWKD
jgi:hypothetical protein